MHRARFCLNLVMCFMVAMTLSTATTMTSTTMTSTSVISSGVTRLDLHLSTSVQRHSADMSVFPNQQVWSLTPTILAHQQSVTTTSSSSTSLSSSSSLSPMKGSEQTRTGLSWAELICGTYVSPVVCLFGIACNALNVIVLTRRNMTGSPYTYLLGLAVTDITVLTLSVIESMISKRFGKGIYFWQFYEAFIFQPIANVFSNSSVWITVLLTVERYVSVRYPLRAKKLCTRRLARRSIILIVIISFILNIPRFLASTITTEQPPTPSVSQNSSSQTVPLASSFLYPSTSPAALPASPDSSTSTYEHNFTSPSFINPALSRDVVSGDIQDTPESKKPLNSSWLMSDGRETIAETIGQDSLIPHEGGWVAYPPADAQPGLGGFQHALEWDGMDTRVREIGRVLREARDCRLNAVIEAEKINEEVKDGLRTFIDSSPIRIPLVVNQSSNSSARLVQERTYENDNRVSGLIDQSTAAPVPPTTAGSVVHISTGVRYEKKSSPFESTPFYVVWMWSYILIIHFIPCAFVMYLNVSLIAIVYRANRSRIALRGSPCWAGYGSEGGCYSKEQIRLTITCISIVCLFLVCIVPSAFSNRPVAKALFGQGQSMNDFTATSFYRVLRITTNLLVFCNLSLNFILYCVFNHKFLYTLRRLGSAYMMGALHQSHDDVPPNSAAGSYAGGGGGTVTGNGVGGGAGLVGEACGVSDGQILLNMKRF